MDPRQLIPVADTIPAPAWVFLALGLLTFTLHILVINGILGTSAIALFGRIFPARAGAGAIAAPTMPRVPSYFALGINFGVAPLLFLQVLYGHLFYTSSILMASWWIAIIPLLILAYYGAYTYAGQVEKRPALAALSLALMITFILYIGFMFVNNITLMLNPAQWTGYFSARDGTMLNLSDSSLWPRYLHFVAASLAVGGLSLAAWWRYGPEKMKKEAQDKQVLGLKIFGHATGFQVGIGFWFLLALPQPVMMQFMGDHPVATILLGIGIAAGIAVLVTGLLGEWRATIILFALTMVVMVLMRHFVREFMLTDWFSLATLQIQPQYDVLALFLVIFVVGLVSIGLMLRWAFPKATGGQA
jgi:hypothetical protein